MGENLRAFSTLIILLVALLFISGASGCSSSEKKVQNLSNIAIEAEKAPQTTNTTNEGGNVIQSNPQPSTKTIEITALGFSPSPLTISAGDTVIFLNKDTANHWPASAMHPTHTVYPGSGIEKCGTSEQSSIFDACKGLKQGESFSFTFNQKGSWSYHDHLILGKFGKIIVQ